MIWTQNITSKPVTTIVLTLNFEKNLNFIFRRVPNPDRFKVDHHGHGFNIMGFHQLFMVFEDSEKSHI